MSLEEKVIDGGYMHAAQADAARRVLKELLRADFLPNLHVDQILLYPLLFRAIPTANMETLMEICILAVLML